MSQDVYTRWIPEYAGVGRLGRHVQHDQRSRRFAYDTTGLSVTPVRHYRHVPVFDQGLIGSCTGNAAVGCLATDPMFPTVATGTTLDESEALKVYSLATTLDEDPDVYPPTDAGSTGLAAAKALQQLGLIGGYQHTFTFVDMLKALTFTPVMVGINWYSSFDALGSGGVAKITKHAEIRGGHEIYADEITKDAIGFTNSWSSDWGVSGRFYLSFTDMERLLAEAGDVTVPIAAPIVGPSGLSGASVEDVALYADMQRWAVAKGLT